MAQGNKFGTFGGVFTPAILTILGVIMYLRLPWIVGEGGMWLTIGIVLAAHVISVTTGLSVASIATDKKVEVGGPYYIVSRSLGLPIGGTLGLALYIGLSFSVSLYVIGFCESMLTYFGYEMSKDNIRIAGTITLFAVTGITLISTAFAIKIQYFIMAAIFLSLISILAGSPETVPETAHFEPKEGGASLAVLFGIFFPAVTGFTAGVNMSGDLKDPKQALPKGTLAAIALGLVVYVGLTVFLAYRIAPEDLADPEVLLNFSWIPEFVVAGIWGATLSSAIGSILGAPRILQAKSIDRITPEVFARGRGKSNEPINALMLTFGIAEFGILVGELDVIAAVVSMFFIMTYGFLNLSCAIESWASPDFRPDFKIPRAVPVVGAITCLLIMIQLDFLAMIAATAILSALYLYFKRRELTLETGDTWEGVWSSVVRSGLARLSRGGSHRRNWRPNVVAFTGAAVPGGAPDDDAGSLIRAVSATRGVLTEFELGVGGKGKSGKAKADDSEDMEDLAAQGVFRRSVTTDDAYATIAGICRYHGFSGLEPNTVALPLHAATDDPARFSALWETFADLDYNVIIPGPSRRVVADDAAEGGGRRIDVWWANGRGNVGFGLALVRFVTTAEQWRRADLRFVLLTEDRAAGDVLYKATQRLLSEARVGAAVKVLSQEELDGQRPFHELVLQESRDADLAVVGLPEKLDEAELSATDELATALPSTLFVRASQLFEETAFERKADDRVSAPLTDAAEVEPDDDKPVQLVLPVIPELSLQAAAFDDGLQQVATDFFTRGLSHAQRADARLLERAMALVDKQLPQVARGLNGPLPKQRKHMARVMGSFIFQAHRLLREFDEDGVEVLRDGIAHGVDALQLGMSELKLAVPREVEVIRSVADFRAFPEDSGPLRRLKFRRRFGARLFRRDARYTVRAGALAGFYLDDAVTVMAHGAYIDEARRHYEVLRVVASVLHAARQVLEQVSKRLGGDDDLAGFVADERQRLATILERELEDRRSAASRQRVGLKSRARSIANRFAADLERVDVNLVLRKQRTVSREATEAGEELEGAAERWSENARLRVRRGQLQMAVAGLQHRLRSIVTRARNAISDQLMHGVVADYAALSEAITTYRDGVAEGDAEARLKAATEFRKRFEADTVVSELTKEVQQAVSELPERIVTLSDDEVTKLVEDPFGDPEVLEVALRRMIEVLVESEIIGPVQARAAQIPEVEHRAVGVAQDAVRLIEYHSATDLEADGTAAEAVTLGDDLTTVIETSLARIEAEQSKLSEQAPALEELLHKQLALVMERSHSYAITGGAEGQFVVARGSRDTMLSGVGRATRVLRERTRDLVYRQSAGVLYRRNAGTVIARRIRNERMHNAIVDPMLELVGSMTPSGDLMQRLPFYYRQLFLGKAAIGADFWVGRDAEMAACRRGVDHYHEGYRGALVVIGERNSGKSALCQFMANKLFGTENVFHVFAPPGGSTDLQTLRRRVETELKRSGDLDEIFASMPATSVVVFHDIELWWERGPKGTVIIERLLELVDRHADDVLFVFNLNSYAYRYLDRMTRISDRSLATVTCQPLLAEELKDVVMRRHGSTGLSFTVDGRHSEEMSDFRLAGLFTRFYDVSRGNVGAALQAWIAHMEGVDGDELALRRPTPPLLDIFDQLTPAWQALLVQFVLHKQLTLPRLRRLTGESDAALAAELGALKRMGLVNQSSDGILELDRWAHHLLTTYLAERRIIA